MKKTFKIERKIPQPKFTLAVEGETGSGLLVVNGWEILEGVEESLLASVEINWDSVWETAWAEESDEILDEVLVETWDEIILAFDEVWDEDLDETWVDVADEAWLDATRAEAEIVEDCSEVDWAWMESLVAAEVFEAALVERGKAAFSSSENTSAMTSSAMELFEDC